MIASPAAPTVPHSAAEKNPFQPRLPSGQSVKVIGLGGVGGIVARYGGVFLASLGADARLVFIDGDHFEAKNAARMLFSIGGNKAEIVRADLKEHFADSRLTLDAISEFVTAENIARLVRDGDIVILTVDNHATRKLVNDFCSGADGGPGLANVCLISGGNDGVGPDSSGKQRRGTFGNCQIYVRRDGQDLCAPLTRHHREIEQPADKLPTDLDCVEAIASTPQVLFANLAAASSILSALWLYLCGKLAYGEVVFDIAEGLMRPLPYPGPHPGPHPGPKNPA